MDVARVTTFLLGDSSDLFEFTSGGYDGIWCQPAAFQLGGRGANLQD